MNLLIILKSAYHAKKQSDNQPEDLMHISD